MTRFQSKVPGLVLRVAIVWSLPAALRRNPRRLRLQPLTRISATVESRLAQQHRSQNAFLAPASSDPQSADRLRRGELIVEQLTPAGGRGCLARCCTTGAALRLSREPKPRTSNG